MEQLLHFVWKYKIFNETALYTNQGCKLTVIDPGIPNTNAGPDFFNAKIKLADKLWAGSIEIHTRASDWIRHHHNRDRSYDNVILHIVEKDDKKIFRPNGEEIPQLVLSIPEKIRNSFEWLHFREKTLPCMGQLSTIPTVYYRQWMDRLLTERLERKIGDILNLYEIYKGNWNEIFYVTLARHFGQGVNNNAFEQIARNLPLKYIEKQRGNLLLVEALLFGQSGLLNDSSSCPYYLTLKKEYIFMKHKYNLHPMDHIIHKNLRIRPESFPSVKLAQLAAILNQKEHFFSILLETNEINSIRNYFRMSPSSYWQEHYLFGRKSSQKEKIPGGQVQNNLLINAVVPTLFAYGIKTEKPEYTEKANLLLEKLPAEDNYIIRSFSCSGLKPEHAGDSQSLIQLKREYCEKKKCIFCQFGFQILKRYKI